MTKKSDEKSAKKSSFLRTCQTAEQTTGILGRTFERKHGIEPPVSVSLLNRYDCIILQLALIINLRICKESFCLFMWADTFCLFFYCRSRCFWCSIKGYFVLSIYF